MYRRLFLLAILVGLLLLPWTMPPAHPSQSMVSAIAASEASHLPRTVTDAQGRFAFPSVPLATHQVYLVESTLPARWQTDLPQAPIRLTLHPGMALSGRVTPRVVLEARYQGDTIAGAVFADLDGDGQMSAGDIGLAGVTVVDPGIHQFFVPFYDDDLQDMFADINESDDCYSIALPPTSDTLDSIISLTASADGTEVFYDHWEDEYDADPLSPGPTTERVVLNAGQSYVWQDQVITPREPNLECAPGRYCYDGRDRITVAGHPGTLIRAAWPVVPDSRLAGAWEVWEVAKWGTSYVVPVGEDLGSGQPNPPDYNDFDWVGLQVQTAVTTTIRIDSDADGTVDIVETLPPGECHAVIGDASAAGVGINSGATVTADAPVQVQLMTGACGSPYAARAYTLIPSTGDALSWSNDYYSPVPSLRDSEDVPAFGTCPMDDNPYVTEPVQTSDVAYYIFNENGADIDVTWETATASGVVTVGANEAYVLGPGVGPGPDPLPLDSAVHLFSDDNFWALAAVDSASSYGASQDFDWGFAVLPLNQLSSQVVLGWSTGYDMANVPPDQDNGNLAFVTPIVDTRIYVDLDNDGTPDNFDSDGSGALENPNAYGLDETNSFNGVPVGRLEGLRVSDPNDNDLSGALIYTLDVTHRLAVAWGEDGCQANTGTGYLDLGYTVLPVTIPIVAKLDELANDADGSGDISPGDTLTYTVILENNGFSPMSNVVLTDTLPSDSVDFVLDSIDTTLPYEPPGVQYDDGTGGFGYVPLGAPGTTDPAITAFRLRWATLDVGTMITTTFNVVIEYRQAGDAWELCNVADVSSDNTELVSADTCRSITQQEPPPTETPTITPTSTPTSTSTPTATPTTTGTPPTPTHTVTGTPPTPTPTVTGTPPTPTPRTTPAKEPPGEIPEPLTIVLVGSGLAALAGFARLRRR